MVESLEELGRFLDSMNNIDKYEFCPADQGEGSLEGLKQFEEIEDVNLLKLLLVILGEKKGCGFSQKLPDREHLDELVDYLNSHGLNVWKAVGLEEEKFVYIDVKASRENPGENFFDNKDELRAENPEKYHREMGEFFGYPEESIEAFNSKPSIRERIRNFIARFTGLNQERSSIIGVEQALGKYGEELSDDRRRDLRTLIFYMLKDDPESFSKAVDRAEERRKAIEKAEEETGTDLTELQENYLELLDSFGQ
ncbi:MAG: hypothetical protein ABEK00_00880 [Candidatus Nanohaloarchaea archaeon]